MIYHLFGYTDELLLQFMSMFKSSKNFFSVSVVMMDQIEKR